MSTVSALTEAATTALLAGKADLTAPGGILPDAQAPSISVKKDTWVVDLSDHGGVGDNVTSNDTAFASALAAINPTWGGKIVLRAGAYVVSGSAAIALTVAGTIIEGAGPGATSIVIGGGFTGTDVISIQAAGCQVKDLSIKGANTTTTSNPVVHGIIVSSVSRPKITNCSFWYINGWAAHIIAGSASGTNPSGGMFNDLIIRSCAGGLRFFGNSGSGSVSCLVSDVQIVSCGVSTGTSANLDAIDLEDAWDVQCTNIIAWMTAGTGSALHLKGNCITNIFKNMDLEGSLAGPTVLLEDGVNGYTYNVKLEGGTVQLGTIGVRITGQAKVVSLNNLNVVNNKTHGISVEGTGNPINIRGCYFTSNGSGASGTNYEINWTGSSIGFVIDPRFETAITAAGVAGVQTSINVPASQNVRLINTSFAGVGQSSSNWMTATPNAVLDTTSGAFNFITRVTLALGIITQGNVSTQPSALSSIVMSANVAGTAAFDSFRLTGDGTMNAGPGTAARDTTWGRVGTAEFGSSDSDIATTLVGKGFRIKEGTNARMGTATLAAGTVTVANTSVTANTRIVLAATTGEVSTNAGALYVNTATAGTGFTIKSTNAADTSKVGYVLFETA